MASPLMSPPHNGTPFIYFTERMSSVISTALKSYYLNVNDEWIDRGCQEQYLFVCPGQPWLFLFNSIPPLPLSVIDNWCDVTLPSEDVEFFSGKNTPGWLVIARCWAAAERFVVLAAMSQVTTWHRCDPQGAGGLAGRKLPLSPLICPQTVPPWLCRSARPRALCLCEVVQLGMVILFFFSMTFFFWKMSKLWGCAADWQPRVSSKSLVQHRGQPR